MPHIARLVDGTSDRTQRVYSRVVRLPLLVCAVAALAMFGCAAGLDPVSSAPSMTTSAPTTSASPPTLPAANEVAVKSLAQTCSSHQSFGSNLEASRPVKRKAALTYLRSPVEAARRVQKSPFYGDSLGAGTLSEPLVVGTRYLQYVFSVLANDDSRVGEITVRRVGFGAFAPTHVEACSP